MKSILVPTDFSTTANSAFEYAVGFAKQLKINSIVLLHCLQPVVSADPFYPLASSDIISLKEIEANRLKDYASNAIKYLPETISISTELVVGNLETSIAEYCNKNEVSYIVMGITGGNKMEAKVIGSNTLSVSNSTDIPVIIIPNGCGFKHISKVTFLCDYIRLVDNLPEEKLATFLNDVNPILEVLHIDPNLKRESDINAIEKFYLNAIIHKYQPNYKYSNRADFEEAVNDLVDDNNIQMIISISKEKTWLQKIFSPNNIKNLAFHTKVPLMVLHK